MQKRIGIPVKRHCCWLDTQKNMTSHCPICRQDRQMLYCVGQTDTVEIKNIRIPKYRILMDGKEGTINLKIWQVRQGSDQ